MSEQDYNYLVRRAERQLELAQAAKHPAATAAHYRIASAYLDRAEPLATDRPTAPAALAPGRAAND